MAVAALACALPAAARATPAGALTHVRAIAAGGFGDPRNSYAWSMAWFRGSLYVGTARSALCVERATMAYYTPIADAYSRHPADGVTCPRSIYDADLRAEIWRYSPRTGRWTRVYRSPTLANPRAPGRRVARDIGYRGMAVLKAPGRPAALYVGAVTADEFIPELARRHPPRLLRTTDGRHFRALPSRPMVIHDHLGPQRPIGFRTLTAFKGRLYATASAGLTGDGVVLRVDHPDGRRPAFRQVSPRNLAVFELAPFAGRLYAGTGDFATGYGVYRTDGRPPYAWQPVVTGGAGRGQTVTSVVSMQTYRGRLYVGASGWGTSLYPPSELIRIAPDDTWELVVGNVRDVDGRTVAPVSRLPDGFGNPFNSHFWRMQVYRGALLLGTNDWSWSLRGRTVWDERYAGQFGFDLYGTCDGNDWWLATRDAFGRGADDFGVRTMAASAAGLFIGTTNHIHGTTILRTRVAPCER